MTFYHPHGNYDDQLWALALAVYAAKDNNLIGLMMESFLTPTKML